jgi:PmbA protein
MSVDLQQRAADAVDMLVSAGADDAWASASQSRNVEFVYRDGALEKVQDTTSRNLAVQVYAGGRYSSHQTTDLQADRLRYFLTEAVALTAALEPDPHRMVTPAGFFANRPEDDLDLVDSAVHDIDREKRMAWCVALDDAARKHERLISATSRVLDGAGSSASASSNGFSGSQQSTYCWMGSSITLRDRGERRASSGFFAGSPHVADVPDAGSIASIALRRTLMRLDAEKGPTTKSSMVVDASVAAQLIGRLLGPANARSVQQGRSFWTDLVGEQAFSPKLSIIDDPLIVRGLGSRHYDREGISAGVLPIIKAGVVRNLYVDTYYGRKAGMTPTTGASSNRRVVTGTQTLAELLSDVGNGVYVSSWLGGNADSTTGDFSLGLSGHMIENGKIARPVSEMNVTGNLKDLFGRLDAVGNDPYPYSRTLAPSLVFSDVDFSGV